MKILYFGDVFAAPGRAAVLAAIRKLVPLHAPDFIILNGENAAHGHGILPEMVEEFLAAGVDLVTLGNHAWDQKNLLPLLSYQYSDYSAGKLSRSSKLSGAG
jgi:calcineurin-like phosphoesterase